MALGTRRRRSGGEIDAALVGLVDRVTRRMRDANRVGRTVTIRLRFDDFSRATRSHTLAVPSAHTATILSVARELLAAAGERVRREGLTMVGVAVSNLSDADAVQLALPFGRASGGALDHTLDEIRHRFGKAAVGRALHLGQEPGWEMPMLPD
jgi:DNA polymerase-4